MSYEDIIRAWKDEDYRMSLSEEERAQLPAHPAGLIELTDTELELVGGGYGHYDEGDEDGNFDEPSNPEFGTPITIPIIIVSLLMCQSIKPRRC